MSSFVPRLEQLEDRIVPAIVAKQEGGTLNITGDDASNNILIRGFGDGTFRVFDNGVLVDEFADVRNINVVTGAGLDQVLYRQIDALQEVRLDLDVFFGPGGGIFKSKVSGGLAAKTTLQFDIYGSDQADRFDIKCDRFDLAKGARFNTNLFGNGGDDVVRNAYCGFVAGKVVYNALGGSGNDNLFQTFQELGKSTGDIVATVQGNSGNDQIGLLTKGKDSLFFAGLDGGSGKNACIRTANVLSANCDPDTVVPFFEA